MRDKKTIWCSGASVKRWLCVSSASAFLGVTLCSAASDTRRVGVMDFQNTPVQMVIEYMAGNLLDKPAVVAQNIYGSITYRSPGELSIKGALAELTDLLQSNGIALIEIDSRYYRLCQLSETNRATGTSHVEIKIEKNVVTVDGEPVPVQDVVPATQKRVTPQSEIWIRDSRNSTNANFETVYAMLNNADMGRQAILRVYVPATSGSEKRRVERQ